MHPQMLSQWLHKSSYRQSLCYVFLLMGYPPWPLWVQIHCFQAEFCNGAEGSASDWPLMGIVTVFFTRKILLKKLTVLKTLDCQRSKQKLCFTTIIFPWAALILLAIVHTLLYSLIWMASQIQLTICGLQIHIHGVDKETRRLDIQVMDIKLSMGRLSL